MEYRFLGKTGLKVSAIGFGGIPIQRTGMEEAVDTIRQALELGINFFDTARGYSDSEKKIGLALKGRRSQVILATKSMARNKSALKQELEQSLRDLRTDYIDLYQLHNLRSREALEKVFGPEGALEGLEEARREGRFATSALPAIFRPCWRKPFAAAPLIPCNFPSTPWNWRRKRNCSPWRRRWGWGLSP